MHSRTPLFFPALCSAICLQGQPTIEWSKCLGGTAYDYAHCANQSASGGFIVTGTTASNDWDVTNNHGLWDLWLVKLTEGGTLEWQRTYGGTSYEAGNEVRNTSDGGYVVVGYACSNDGDVTGTHSSLPDVWVVKFDALGAIQWQKCLGGGAEDVGQTIEQTADGGYIISGRTWSSNGDVSGNHGDVDNWVVKLDSAGTLQWQRCLGGSGEDYGVCLRVTPDGGYILACQTWSMDNGDVSGHHGLTDIWVVKLDSLGSIQWQRCLGGSDYEGGGNLCTTSDGGYLVVGHSWSNDGDVSGGHGEWDMWCVKLDAGGTLEWQKCLGGTAWDAGWAVEQTGVNRYSVSGTTESNDGDVSGLNGLRDAWLVELDTNGNLIGQKCFGGSLAEDVLSVHATADGGCVASGGTLSNDGDVSDQHGANDAWVVKFAGIGTGTAERVQPLFTLYPDPTSGLFSIVCSTEQLPVRVTLFDTTGRALWSRRVSCQLDLQDMDISTRPCGIYTVQLAFWNGASAVQRIVRQ